MAVQNRPLTQMPTMTELANREFLERVERIPGVIAVKPYGGASLGEQDIAVLTETLFSETAERVYELEGEIRHKYRGSRLSVKVRGVKETGLTVEQFAARYK